MKNRILFLKSNFYINVLKILGVCGILIIIDASCTPKTALTPNQNQKFKSTKDVKENIHNVFEYNKKNIKK